MSDLDTILGAVTDAQHRASVQVILPVILRSKTFYSEAAIDEWQMFKPLADSFAGATAPATALNNPLQFINWVCAHPEIHGTKQYINHLVTQEVVRKNLIQSELNEIQTLLDAENFLNQSNIVVPGHEISS